MKTIRSVLPVLVLALALVLVGCGRNQSATDEHGHDAESHSEEAHADHGDHETGESQAESAHAGHGHGEEGHEQEEASGAEFAEGKGILLAQPAREMIGLETAEVSERELALEFTATARVFHAAHQHGDEFPGHKDGHAYANAIVPAATADLLKVGQAVELNRPSHSDGGKLQGILRSLDRETARAIGQVEAVIEIPDPDESLEFGAFLNARFAGAERTTMVVPRPALVDAATGTFVYAQNGEHWLRTPVKVGGANESYVEILDGLFEGDIVASKGATDLWLIELRFTKGGGHSH
jgi:hypothetical protein